MSLSNGVQHNTNLPPEGQDQDFSNVDIEKFFGIIRKSLPWILAIIVFSVLTAYLIVRYTPYLYESKSVLQLDVKSEASVFGFKNFNEDISNISKEIEFLRSNLFLGKVVNEIDINVSYYAMGEFLNNERYSNNPFKVEYEIYNPDIYDRNIEITIFNPREYSIKYPVSSGAIKESKHEFGDTILTKDFKFHITLTNYYDPQDDHTYYFFRINSKGSLISYLSRNITVQPLDFQANTITLSFKDHNKYKARDLVMALDTLYLYYTKQEKNKETDQKISFLNEQLTVTEQRLNELEDYFEDFTIEYKTTNLDNNLSKTIGLLEKLDSQKFNIQRKVRILNDLYEKVINEENFVITTSELASLPQNILSEVTEYEKLLSQKMQLQNSYKPNTYVIQKAEKELNYITERILLFIDEYKESLLQQLADINRQRVKREEDFVSLPSKKTEYTKTERYYSLYEEFYLTLMKNKAQFELAQAGTTTDYKILSPASLPSNPISPNAFLYLGVGAIAGIIISLLFLGIRYLIHNKVSGQKEIEHMTHLPILGSIPFYKKVESNRLVVDKHPKSELSEAFRALRTNMEFINGSKGKPIICVSSSVSGEGKTFVSVNLGGIISMLENKVVILDLDMRKPRLQKVFYNQDQNVGVSTILIGKTKTADCIQKTNLKNLDYIASGPIPPNPAELVAGEYFDKMIDDLKSMYDIIIIDTPPIGLVTDGIIALKKATIPIFVVRAEFSRKSYIRSINKLCISHRLRNPSIVVNSVKRSGSYGYGYGKGGYGYYEEESDPSIFNIKTLLGL